jgi:hypothetical protein
MLERRVQGLGEERAIGAVVWGTCEGIFALEQQVGENAEFVLILSSCQEGTPDAAALGRL